MERRFSYIAGVLILFSSLLWVGCPKKVSSVEGSAGLSKEKPSESLPKSIDKPKGMEARPLSPPPQEEKFPPLAQEKPSGDGKEAMKALPSEGAGGEEKPTSLEDVFFDFDQWLIRSDAKRVLEQDADWLIAHQESKIQIEGHCDERGTGEYNLALGERRAKSVKNYLVSLGVSPSRVSIISYGEEKPFCNDRNEFCYQKNRRAHFVPN